MTAILWFTQDLRLEDNPALNAACDAHDEVIPVYVHDTENAWPAGGARQWWLYHSLTALQAQIKDKGGRLILRKGNPETQILELMRTTEADALYFNRSYLPALATVQKALHDTLSRDDIECKRYNGTLLIDPEAIRTQSDKPFQVFTPFYKQCMKVLSQPTPKTRRNIKLARKQLDCDELKDWDLLPTKPNWAKGFTDEWTPGTEGAKKRLQFVKKNVIADYDDTRNIPSKDGTSKLSPHLHHGELSPRQVWHAVKEADGIGEKRAEPYLREVIWREFSYYLLHHWPHIPEKSFKEKFEDFPWNRKSKKYDAWCHGKTGYPMVDAGMRQLWHTGWMHNRVRMITASFLTKHLRLHWKLGEEWFWDTLVDADLASNAASWQWVAGSGADAAPYFRIFNPTTQAEKFDPNGDYIKRWVPELKNLPKKYIHEPWTADATTLKEAGVELDKDYPRPIVDHKAAREAALDAYKKIK